MNPEVSVIVPIYDVSSSIERCAYSLFNQTLKNVEFIFVNDATPDDSIEKLENVLKLYPELVPNVKIIHHTKNCGTAIARNAALSHTNGNYILMVDSDDYIDTDMLNSLYTKAVNANADIVVSDLLIEYKKKTIYCSDYLSSNPDDHFKDMLLSEKSSPSLCNKLIKKDLYMLPQNRNTFQMKYMEDRYVVSRLYFYAKKIVKVDRAFYHYTKQNPVSSTNFITHNHFENTLLFWSSMDKFMLSNNIQNEYAELVSRLKTNDKVKLMFYTTSVEDRKTFSEIFSEEGKMSFDTLKLSEKVMLKLLRKRMFKTTWLLREIVYLKNKIF